VLMVTPSDPYDVLVLVFSAFSVRVKDKENFRMTPYSKLAFQGVNCNREQRFRVTWKREQHLPLNGG
jgi:hypothetical protein